LASVEFSSHETLLNTIYASVNKGLEPLGLQLLNVDLHDVRLNSQPVFATPTAPEGGEEALTELVLSKQEMNALINGKAIVAQLFPDGERSLRILPPIPPK
ncbi:MAG: hypothetical protein AAF840_18120, partial [Bacteroidota bacterium]